MASTCSSSAFMVYKDSSCDQSMVHIYSPYPWMFVLNKKKSTNKQIFRKTFRVFSRTQSIQSMSKHTQLVHCKMYSLLYINSKVSRSVSLALWIQHTIWISHGKGGTFTEQSVWESSRGVWVSKSSGLDSECPPWETQDSDTIAAGHRQRQQKFCSATEETQLHSHRCPAHPLLPNLLHDK